MVKIDKESQLGIKFFLKKLIKICLTVGNSFQMLFHIIERMKKCLEMAEGMIMKGF